jgi:hypothetical protein
MKSLTRFAVSTFLAVVCLVFSPACRAGPQDPSPSHFPSAAIATTIKDETLVYVSDYFSFVGSDTQGRVSFALDNNRGRDGEKYQAEHFLVLHDEHSGWVPLIGNGAYNNAGKVLVDIPDSQHFKFQGAVHNGLTIHGPSNNLVLKIDPVAPRVVRTHGGGSFWLGTASASLAWQGRTLTGRVIYEYFMKPDFNRLTRKYFGYWKDFHGLYLRVGEDRDFYFHSHDASQGAELNGKLLGFLASPDGIDPLQGLQVEVLERKQALGFYRWPNAWRISWTGKDGPMSATLHLHQRNPIANWITGGFAMGIVTGEVTIDKRTYPVYGLGELII